MSSPIRIIKPAISEIFKDESLNIRKVNVGEINPSRPFGHGKVLMLLGATGSGKSTLINGFMNYIRGVTYKDDYRYKLVGDEGLQSQAYSQTKRITAYTFEQNSRLPYTFTIIDTPGYGDTDGIYRDKEITTQIKEFFSIKGPHGIDHIDGIGFVVQASLARLTPTQKYIFQSILSIFGKDISKNVFMMITFTDAEKPPVLEAIKEWGFEYQTFFKFNNSALFSDNEKPQNDIASIINKAFWDMGEESFKHFFKIFGSTRSVSLQLTKEVLNEREKLQCLVQSLQYDIQYGLSKIDELHQEKRVLALHEKDIETNKEFTYEIEETRHSKVDLETGQYVTNCLTCNKTCHFPCYIPNDEDKYKCYAMADQSSCNTNCEACPGKCHWSSHRNNEFKYEFYMVKVKKTSEELKKRYEVAREEKTKTKNIMDGLSNDLMSNYQRVLSNVQKTKTCLERLNEIALRPHPLTNVEHIDLLIQSEKMEGKPGWGRRMQSLQDVRKQAEFLSKIETFGGNDLSSAIDQWIQTEKEEQLKGWKERVLGFSDIRHEAIEHSKIQDSEERTNKFIEVIVKFWTKVKLGLLPI